MRDLGDFLAEWARTGAAFGGVIGLGVLLSRGIDFSP